MPDHGVPWRLANSGESAVLKMIRPGTLDSNWSGTGCGWKTAPTWPAMNEAVADALDVSDTTLIQSLGRPFCFSSDDSRMDPGLTAPPTSVTCSPCSLVRVSLSDMEAVMPLAFRVFWLTARPYEGLVWPLQTCCRPTPFAFACITWETPTRPNWIWPAAIDW